MAAAPKLGLICCGAEVVSRAGAGNSRAMLDATRRSRPPNGGLLKGWAEWFVLVREHRHGEDERADETPVQRGRRASEVDAFEASSTSADSSPVSVYRRCKAHGWSRAVRHSARNAMIGFCRMTRRAGGEIASVATTISTAGPGKLLSAAAPRSDRCSPRAEQAARLRRSPPPAA